MSTSINFWFAVGFGLVPIVVFLSFLSCFKGGMGQLHVLIIAVMCITSGAIGQFFLENLSEVYQHKHANDEINAELLVELIQSANFWGNIVGTISISLGVGLLVAYFSAISDRKS